MLDSFDVPAGFAARRDAAGTVLVSSAMQIRCMERLRPLRHPFSLLGPEPRPVTTSSTAEGELVLRTGDRTDEIDREVAMIVGDDFSTLFIGTTRSDRAVLATVIDDLARSTRLWLGVRRRRFLFEPPSGWQGFSLDGFDTHYLAPGHPRAPGCLSVYAARPATSSLAEWWRVNGPLTGAGATFSSVPVLDEPLIGPDHLGGRRVQLRGNDGQRAMAAELTCLADRDYWYPIVLVCDAASLPERSAAVASVIRSIRPLTRPAPTSAQVAAVHHWFQ